RIRCQHRQTRRSHRELLESGDADDEPATGIGGRYGDRHLRGWLHLRQHAGRRRLAAVPGSHPGVPRPEPDHVDGFGVGDVGMTPSAPVGGIGRETFEKAMSRPRVERGERGQGLVEFAVAMPLLLLILLGTIDMGRVFFDYIEMRQAAVEGATYGARR